MASVSQAADRDTLQEVVEFSVELAHVLDDGLSAGVIVPDLKGWNYGMPLRPENQIRYLAIPCVEQLEYGARALGERFASIGFGAARFLAESYVRIAWLMDPEDDATRQRRAFQWGRHEMRSQRKMQQWITKQEPDPVRRAVDEHQSALLADVDMKITSLAAGMGFTRLDDDYPDRVELFNRFFPSKYRYFAMMSHYASHPSWWFGGMFSNRDGQMVTTDIRGGWYFRAYWIGSMVGTTLGICRMVGGALQREDWLTGEVAALDERFGPLDARIRHRWHSEADPSFEESYNRIP